MRCAGFVWACTALAACADDSASTAETDAGTTAGTTTVGSGSTDAGTTGGGSSGGGTALDESSSGGFSNTFDDPFASGPRMRAIILDGGEGAERFEQWHDAELGFDCEVAEVDGVGLRCVPGRRTSANQFADSGCTERIYVEGPGTDCVPRQGPPAFLSHALSFGDCGADGPVLEVFAVGESLGQGIYYTQIDGDCVEASDPLPRYALSPADTSEWAAFDRVVVPRGSGLGVTVFTGPDGSHAWGSMVDLERDVECFSWGQRPPTTCIPVNAGAFVSFLRDEMTCGGDGLVVNELGDGCDPVVVLADGVAHEVGALVDAPTLFRGNEDSCEVTNDWDEAWELGPLATPDVFPAVQFVEVGTGGLRVRYLESDEGSLLPTHWSFDWANDVRGDCFPRESVAGLRCVPSGAEYRGQYWGDAACSATPIHAENSEFVKNTPAEVRHARTYDECRNVLGVVALGSEYDGELFVSDSEGGCTALENPLSSQTFFELAEMIDAEQLSAIDPRTE